MEKSFGEGFHFALMVLGAMGKYHHTDEIADYLRDLMKGNVTLMPSPEEAIEVMETEAQKEFARKMLTGETRQRNDEAARRRARAVLEYMGEGSEKSDK